MASEPVLSSDVGKRTSRVTKSVMVISGMMAGPLQCILEISRALFIRVEVSEEEEEGK